jgi:alpha-1,2-mannosyltransferase
VREHTAASPLDDRRRLRLLPPWPSVVFWLLFAVFVSINAVNALHKGGDFEVFVQGAQRVQEAADLYRDSSPGQGVIGPPFQSVFFVPAAWMWDRSETAARVLWYAIGLTALGTGVWLWGRALPWPHDLAARPDGAARLSWPMLLSIAAIALPAQTNFEHQNLNTVLLCATGAAAWALHRRRAALAGAWIGVATALKAFPGLLLLYLLVRREWRAATTGLLTAAALSASPALWYGPAAVVDLPADWLALNREGGWPIRLQNQSLFAAWARVTAADGFTWFLISAVALMGLLLAVAWQMARRQPPDGLPQEMALALVVAVLLSPIAWDHYWVLTFPGFLLVARWLWLRGGPIGWLGFGLAAVLVSGISPVTAGAVGFDRVRSASGYTVAGLLLATGMAWVLLPGAAPAGGQKKRPE